MKRVNYPEDPDFDVEPLEIEWVGGGNGMIEAEFDDYMADRRVHRFTTMELIVWVLAIFAFGAFIGATLQALGI